MEEGEDGYVFPQPVPCQVARGWLYLFIQCMSGSVQQNQLKSIFCYYHAETILGFPGSVGKEPPAMQEMQEIWVRFLGREDPLEEDIATHSSILAWRIPWTEEPGRLQSIGHKESDMTEVTEHMHTHRQF